MLTMDDVVGLEKKLRNRKALSVYVNGSLSDPAERKTWRLALDAAVDKAREAQMNHFPHDGGDFASAVALLNQSLPNDSGIHAAKGWVAFITSTEALLTASLPTSVPNLVAWDTGIHVAPVFRALKQLTPVFIVLADKRSSQILRYVEGNLEDVERIEAEGSIGPVYHMGDAPRGGFHAGVHGTTGADEADRVQRAAVERMAHDVEERLRRLADREGWILIGGPEEICGALERALPPRLKERATVDRSLHRRSTRPEVIDAARTAASQLRTSRAARMVEVLSDMAAAHGKAAVGVVPTLDALRANAVQTLLFTPRLMDTYPDLAESLVRLALQHGADVEHLNGMAAQKLDAEFDGVAARLRFVTASP
jgi:peptide subunit release factor 1 (eRF1)